MDLIKDLINCDQDKLNELSDKIYEDNRNNIDYWNFMITNTILDENIILENLDNFDKILLIKNQKISKNVILNEKFLDKDNIDVLNLILSCQSLDMDTLEELIKLNSNLDWVLISKFQNLSIFFIDKYKDKLDWVLISEFQYLPVEYISLIKDKICFESLGKNVKISNLINDDFINKFKDEDIWNCLIWSDNLSDETLLNYIDKLNDSQIQDLLEVKKLDMNLITYIIEKYSHVKDIYDYLVEGQILTEDFLNENLDKFSKKLLVINQDLSFEFLYKIRHQFDLCDLSLNDNLKEEVLDEIIDNLNEFNGKFDVEYIKDNLDISLTTLNKINSLSN